MAVNTPTITLTATPLPLPTAIWTATPDLPATAAAGTQVASNATQTALALPPTPTLTATPDLAATATQQANEQATAAAATLTAEAPPTATPTTPPNLTATAQEQAAEQTALYATLTALAPTVTATPTPDLAATGTEEARQMETMVAVTLTEIARHFTPTPTLTATPQPPTATPIPPPPTKTRLPPRPTKTPRPTPRASGFFQGSVNPICNGERNMTWFEGAVYVNNQPANGYKIVFKSYLVPGDQPATAPAISGPHKGYTDWANGYYAHIVNDHFTKKHLEIWIINDAGAAISNRVRWDTDGTDGPCNKAIINFSQ